MLGSDFVCLLLSVDLCLLSRMVVTFFSVMILFPPPSNQRNATDRTDTPIVAGKHQCPTYFSRMTSAL